jgi:hypothetical protein
VNRAGPQIIGHFPNRAFSNTEYSHMLRVSALVKALLNLFEVESFFGEWLQTKTGSDALAEHYRRRLSDHHESNE